MELKINTKYLGTFSKEALGWILHEYHSNKRIGKKCRSCGHIQGKPNKDAKKNGWKEIRFCSHHYDTHHNIMQRYRELTCASLHDFLDCLTEGIIVTKDNVKGQIEPINIFFWQQAEDKLRREFGNPELLRKIKQEGKKK